MFIPDEQFITLPIGMDCRGLRTSYGWEAYWIWKLELAQKWLAGRK